MAGRYGDIDYPTLTKRSFFLGLSLFLLGLLGEFVVQTFELQIPGWEQTVLFDMVVVGLVVAFFSPIVFGIVLPLTE